MAIESLKRELHRTMKSIPGLLAILLIDRDGVPLIEVHQDITPELAMQASALSLTILAADQVSKLGFGKNNTICSEFENYQVVTFNKSSSPLLIILIANSTANSGMLLALESEFDEISNELKKIKI